MRKYSFEELKLKIEERLYNINYEVDKYSLNINCRSSESEGLQAIEINYDNKKILQFNYFISNVISQDKSLIVRGLYSIKRLNDADWYDGVVETIHVDEFFRCGYNDNRSISLDEVLNRVLPLSDTNEIDQIKTSLEKEGFENLEIKFDTLRKRYIVIGNLSHILGLVEDKLDDENDLLYLYKYMSLDTYFVMLMHKTFRMNSIVSMNDESESFFLSDKLCNIYRRDGMEEMYLNTIENRSTLITSFTDQCDSGLMWRLYGCSGRGVCLAFQVPRNRVKKIHYISERDTGYSKLKKCVDDLNNQDITLYFKDIDNFKYYTKSDGFKYEDEYRLSYTCPEDDLTWAKYGDVLSPYRDFSFIKNRCEIIDIRLCDVWIGAKLPHFDVNYPLLVELTNKRLHTNIIYISKQDKFRE